MFKKEHIEELFKAREEVCKKCIWYSENQRGKSLEEIPEIIRKIKGDDVIKTINGRPDIHCINCGCNIGTKGRCLTCNCPLMNWTAVAEPNLALEIEKIISEKNKGNDGSSTKGGS